MTDTDYKVRNEIIEALTVLGADSELLAIVGSWHDTMPSEMILCHLKDWHAKNRKRNQLTGDDDSGHVRVISIVSRAK